MSLKGIIDFKEEKEVRKKPYKNRVRNKENPIKLNDNNFINNAPEEIINEQKEREKNINYPKKNKKQFKVLAKYMKFDKNKLPSRHVSLGLKELLIDLITMQWA